MKRFIIVLFALFAVINTYGQCRSCPSSLQAPGSTGSTPLPGTLFTSQITPYDGTVPDCYDAVANNLNGHLEGIDNRLCELGILIDSLESSSTRDSIRIEEILVIIDSLETLYDSLIVTYDLVSDDGTVDITTTTVGNMVEWDISVNIDAIKDSLLANIDASCLTDSTGWDDVMQELIDVVCALNTAATDTCSDAQMTFTASVSSNPTAIAITATASEVDPLPTNMEITDIVYYYYVYDADTVLMPSGSGYVNAPSTLGVPYAWYVPVSYADGARLATVVGRIYKGVTETGAYCGYDDTTYTFSIPAPDIDALIANDYTSDTLQNSETANIHVTSNDVIPYPLVALTIVTPPTQGTVNSTNFTTGMVNYTADNVTGVIDTFSYSIEDIYGQIDTAEVYVPIESCSDSSIFTKMDSICVTRTGSNSFVFNPYWNDIPASNKILSWSLDLSAGQTCDAVAINTRAISTTGLGYSVASTVGGLSSGNLSTQITQSATTSPTACAGTHLVGTTSWTFTISWENSCGSEEIESIELSLPAGTYSAGETGCF